MKRGSVLLAAALLGLLACRPSTAADVTGHHLLSNGLQVRLYPDSSTPLIGTLVLVGTGYALEGPANLGYSHLLEHLVFAGTSETDKEELFRLVESMGGYLNGYTRDDYMGYLMVGHRDDFRKQMELLSSILFRAALRKKDLAAAKEVVHEEIRRYRSRPGTRVDETFQDLAYAGSAYARTGLGNERTVSSVSREEIAAHYRRVYRPDNMVLLAAGGIDAAEVLETLRETFGAAAPGAGALLPAPPPPIRGRRVHHLRTDIPDLRVQAAFTGPDPREGDAEALELLGALLGGRGGRLQAALEAAGFSPRSVSAGLAINRGFSRFNVSAALPASEDGERALQVMLQELAGVAAGDLTDGEVDTVRDALEAGEIMDREKLHYYLMGKASWVLAGGPGQGFSERRWDAYDGRTLAGTAARYLDGRPYAALVSAPEKTGEAGGAPGDPPRERAVLDNGLVIVAEQRPGSRVFALNILTRHRSTAEPEGKAGIADFLHRLLPLGTDRRTKEQVEKELRALGASLSTAGDPTVPFGDFYTSRLYSFVRLECLADRAGEAVELVAEMITRPALPVAEVEKMRARLADFIAYREAKPESLAGRLLAERLYGREGLGRDVLGYGETIDSITREDLLAFRERYFTGRNLVVSAVGGMAPGEAVALLESAFSALPPGGEPPLPSPPVTDPGGDVEVVLEKPQGALAAGAVVGPLSPGARPALAVVTGLLNDRLSRELREKEGLAYSVGASLGAVGETAVFSLAMGTAAAKMSQARAGIRREIEKVRSMELSNEELGRRVSALTGRLQMRMLSSLNRGFYIALAEREGLPHTYGEDYRRLLLSLQPEEVERAARAYLPHRLFEVVVR